MNVLIIGLYNNLGGIEKIIYDYVSHIDKTDLNIGFVANPDHIWFEQSFTDMGCKIYKTCNRKNIIKYGFRLYRIIKNDNYQVVHCNILSCANIVPILMAKLAGAHVIVHSHNSASPGNYFSMISVFRNMLHFLNKRLLSLFKCRRLSCSQAAARYMFGNKEYEIVNNAIDVKKYIFDSSVRNTVRRELNVKDDELLIGQVGRFEYQKNQEFSIRLLAEYVKKYPRTKMIFIGAGTNFEKCVQLAQSLNISKNIIFYGFSDKIDQFLSAFDIFLFPSRFEGLSIASIEAQCSGCPMVVSDSIPAEMDKTDLIFRCSLEDSFDKWISAIECARKVERRDRCNELKLKGFDIKTEADKLRKIYFSYN